MAERAERLEFMRRYCENAIKLEREVAMWEKMLRTVQGKLGQLRSYCRQLENQIANENQKLNELGTENQDGIAAKRRQCQKYEKRCKICLALIIVLTAFLLINIVSSGIADRLSVYTGSGAASLLLSVVGGLSASGSIYILLFAIYASNRSKKKKLMDEINSSMNGGSAHRNAAISNDTIQKCQNALAESRNREPIFVKQENEIKAALQQARERRSKFYSMGIIPSVYQNMHAVVSFFFYLDTGQVNVIEGHGGLYDTYREDCKHAELIGTIKEHDAHEQMRHQELIGRIDKWGSKITSSLGRMEAYNAATAYHSAQAAHNSKIQAAAEEQRNEYMKNMQDMMAYSSGRVIT